MFDGVFEGIRYLAIAAVIVALAVGYFIGKVI